MDVIELFLNILKTIVHIFDITTDLMRDNHIIVNALLGFILAGCIIYFLKIDSISDASPYPLALFFTAGIYLSYTFTSWVIAKFNS